MGNDWHPFLFTEAHQDDSAVDAVESQRGVYTNLKCKIEKEITHKLQDFDY